MIDVIIALEAEPRQTVFTLHVSPNWYPGKAAPTWNYRVVHAHGISFQHDANNVIIACRPAFWSYVSPELAGRRLPPGFRVTFCGVGKINAALATAAVLARPDCARVVNFGTAGSLRPELAGQLLRVNRMLQRDMDGRPLAALGDTPFEEGPAAGVIDLGGDGVSLSTGDNFVTAPRNSSASAFSSMERFSPSASAMVARRLLGAAGLASDIVGDNASFTLRMGRYGGADPVRTSE